MGKEVDGVYRQAIYVTDSKNRTMDSSLMFLVIHKWVKFEDKGHNLI